MDFDEYDYLEKTVELPIENSPAAAGNGTTRSEDKERRRRSKHRDDDDGEADRDSGHRYKRARSDDDDDKARDRERGSSRHRSSPDHRSRSRDVERDRDRHRSSGRDHRDERNGKDRERAKEREREYEREREKERERERSRRSRSRSERYRDEERDRREKSRELRERERDRESRNADQRSLGLFHRSISSSDANEEMGVQRYKDKKEEVAEPEADPERDQRTVFAYQIALKADERDVYEFFSRAGKVRDVRLIMDRNSRRSKGVGYIEFYDALSVPMAIALSGQQLLGQPVMVKPSEAEKNLVQSTTAVVGTTGTIGPYSGGARRLYIGNLHFNITEEQLRLVFEPFGPVELVQLPRELETGHCKGYGFIQFARLEDARAALSLNGQLEIAGRNIKVSAVTDQVGMQDVGTNAGDLDDDEGGGLSLNARSRALLMQKLDRTGTATSVPGAIVPPVVNAPVLSPPIASVLGVPPTVSPLLQAPALVGFPTSTLPVVSTTIQPVDTAGVPSECLLLKNMFDPNAETEPDFELDIKEDVQDECSKFGTVKHIFVDKNTAGYVYLRFDSTSSAMSAQRALQGRWFAGKMITATFMTPQNYEAKFPSS